MFKVTCVHFVTVIGTLQMSWWWW